MRKLFAVLGTVLLLAVAATSFAAGPEDTWKISSPSGNANVTGPDVSVTVDPGQVKVVPPGPVKAGEGHWHFFVDEKEVSRGPTNTFVYTGLTAGKHRLQVELHKGDHSIYGNGQEVTVNVSLPNSGASVTMYVIVGVLILGAGAYFFTRRGAVRA